MKKLLIFLAPVFLVACDYIPGMRKDPYNGMVRLQKDKTNLVKLSDKMVIFESTCRGCAFEETTRFEIYDSLGIIKLADIITTDDSPDNVAGGSISKDIILLPLKTGKTTMKLYKIWDDQTASQDSGRYVSYTIAVSNN